MQDRNLYDKFFNLKFIPFLYVFVCTIIVLCEKSLSLNLRPLLNDVLVYQYVDQ